MFGLVIIVFIWPIFLGIGLLYLALEAAAVVVTSPAFPALIVSVVAGVIGTIMAAVTVYRRFKDQEDQPLTLRAFVPILVLYAISFIALCVSAWLAGVSILGFLNP